jgi:hypothetical protein
MRLAGVQRGQIPESPCKRQHCYSLSMEDFLKRSWYAGYLDEVSQHVAVPHQITPATLIWAKDSRRC